MPAPLLSAGRLGPYAVVLLLTALACVYGAFLVPLRIAGVPVPLGVALAAATVPLGVAGGRLLGSRIGAVLPGLLWLIMALQLASLRREGDLVVLGNLRGIAFLGVGTVGALLAVGLWRPAPAARTPPDGPDGRHTGGGDPRR